MNTQVLEQTTASAMEKDVVLILADISGYTRYMVANRHSRIHGQVVISELMNELIKQVEPPLEVAKLEGDAVFMFAPLSNGLPAVETARRISGKIPAFIDAFQRKLSELTHSNICPCDSCKNISHLKIKIIVHQGKALIHQIGRFMELSGVDVIIAHRLLKNSIPRAPYILMTDPALETLALRNAISFEPRSENYAEIGRVNVHVHYPQDRNAPEDKCFCSWKCKTKNELRKAWGDLRSLIPFLRRPRFNNLAVDEES